METATHIRLVLWKAAKAVDRVDRASIKDTGLQVTDFAIMEALLHKGPMPINVIGQKVLLTSGSMTAAINRLQKRNLVRRAQDETDARTFFIYLTSTGRQVIEEAFEKHQRNLEAVMAVFTQKERGEIVPLLKRLGREAENAKI